MRAYAHGVVEVPVDGDPGVPRRVLMLPWGDDERHGGVNVNRLAVAAVREAFTGQPCVNGAVIEVD